MSNKINVNKYFLILESLHFRDHIPSKDSEEYFDEKRLNQNIIELKTFMTSIVDPENLLKELLTHLDLRYISSDHIIYEDNVSFYSFYSLYMLLNIAKNINFHSNAPEDLISEHHKTLIISNIQDVAHWGLQQNLHKAFYKGKKSIFTRPETVGTDFIKLEILVKGFSKLLSIKSLHIGKSLDEPILHVMAAVFSLLLAHETKENILNDQQLKNMNSIFITIWHNGTMRKDRLFRNLMILKSNSELPDICQKLLHRQLLLRLWSPGGFVGLLSSLVEIKPNDIMDQSLKDVVSSIVVQKNYSMRAQQSLIGQILTFISSSLEKNILIDYISVAIVSLRKLYDLSSENQDYIKDYLNKKFENLIRPKNSELLVMQWQEFQLLISELYQIFCISSIECLPSELLTIYLNLMISLHHRLDNYEKLQQQISSLIIKCLNNRQPQELESIIEHLAYQKYPTEWRHLHPHVYFRPNVLNKSDVRIIIENENYIDDEIWNPLFTVVQLVKDVSFNLLTYQIFLILLRMMPNFIEDIKDESNTTNSDLLESCDDICNVIQRLFAEKFQSKLQVMRTLELLVQHEPIRQIINENIHQVLNCLHDFLSKYKFIEITENLSSLMLIIATIIRELLEISTTDSYKDIQVSLCKTLKGIYNRLQESNLKYQVLLILELISDENAWNARRDLKNKSFEEARILVESKKSYEQVEGIEKLIKLINARDPYTIANGHVMLALALQTLKSKESYTFLNCVRLFTALVSIMEEEVLDILADEYLNGSAIIDYRLLIGESLLKTCRELGPICYKYKTVLLNCYMNGCRSPINEYRCSAFANLAQLCRLLTFQVHTFFQELLHLITNEIDFGKYLPARRAAVLVLCELLEGMDNLMDYETMLLPVYKLLKSLETSEQYDEKIRIHAANGLAALSEKCLSLIKSILRPRIQKEIRIINFNDSDKKGRKSHILEII